uniref:Uncharacterized protein n=1 Tax=Meleagris gallopavo TaxID=9103 RepID=A0A803YQL1_MELGA
MAALRVMAAGGWSWFRALALGVSFLKCLLIPTLPMLHPYLWKLQQILKSTVLLSDRANCQL